MISLHWNTLIYALWIVRWNKKLCIDNNIQNEVSDCLRIKTMLSETLSHCSLIQWVADDWQTAVVSDFFPLYVTICNHERISRISRQTKSIIACFFLWFTLRKSNPTIFPLSIHRGWFISSRAPKSDVSFWDGAPFALNSLVVMETDLPLPSARRMRRRRKIEEESDEGSPDFSGLSSLQLMAAAQRTAGWDVVCSPGSVLGVSFLELVVFSLHLQATVLHSSHSQMIQERRGKKTRRKRRYKHVDKCYPLPLNANPDSCLLTVSPTHYANTGHGNHRFQYKVLCPSIILIQVKKCSAVKNSDFKIIPQEKQLRILNSKYITMNLWTCKSNCVQQKTTTMKKWASITKISQTKLHLTSA